MKPLSVLIKPASGNCNMRCTYCFYHDVEETRAARTCGQMSEETAECIIQRAFDYTPKGPITFAFQGGEPTLRGLDFFKHFVATVKGKNRYEAPVIYGIQTNGLLIDASWAAFFREHNFLVGVSLDGPSQYHDPLRIDHSGKGTFDRVMNTISLLQAEQVEFNILCVVNRQNAGHVTKLYRFYQQHNLKYLQFIPLILPFSSEADIASYQLNPDHFGTFLNQLFDLYYRDWQKGNYVSIRFFDNILLRLSGRSPESCDMGGHCSIQNIIEANGDVFPCDFYAIDEFRLGNIMYNSFEELASSMAAARFLAPPTACSPCSACTWSPICPGRCQRYIQFGNPERGENYYCKSFKMFFKYAGERLKNMAMHL